MIMRQKTRYSRGRRGGPCYCCGTDEIRSIVVMGQGAQDLRTFDYYLTTVLKDTKKTGSHCAATASRFAPFFLNICAKLLEPLGHQRSSLDGLITPTLKAAGSNPVGRTKRKPLRFYASRVFIFPCRVFFGVISCDVSRKSSVSKNTDCNPEPSGV